MNGAPDTQTKGVDRMSEKTTMEETAGSEKADAASDTSTVFASLCTEEAESGSEDDGRPSYEDAPDAEGHP